MSPEDIISNQSILNIHIGDFGPRDKRSVVNEALLKTACGYAIGSTAKEILIKHTLIYTNHKITAKSSASNSLSDKGRTYLWSVFGGDFV